MKHLLDQWQFDDPEQSERLFKKQLDTNLSDDELIVVQAQIARTYGLRGLFDEAKQMLSALEDDAMQASQLAQAYFHLEVGRAWCSASHPKEAKTEATRQIAMNAYQASKVCAMAANSDALVVDAMHMMAIACADPQENIQWLVRAMDVANQSSQADAQKWEATLCNNLGYALHDDGQKQQALEMFNRALVLRQQQGNPVSIGIAKWMVAWTLRTLDQYDEALAIQLALMRTYDEANRPSQYVFKELIEIYKALEQPDDVTHYELRLRDVLAQ